MWLGDTFGSRITWADLSQHVTSLLSLTLPGTQLSEASTRSPQWVSLGHTSVVSFEPLGTLGLRVWTVTDTALPHPLWHWQVCAQRAGEAQVSPSPALRAPFPRDSLPLASPPLTSLVWPAGLGWHCPLDPSLRRRAQLKRCLEQLKQQMPLGADCVRYTTLSLLRRARMHIQVRHSPGAGASLPGCWEKRSREKTGKELGEKSHVTDQLCDIGLCAFSFQV